MNQILKAAALHWTQILPRMDVRQVVVGKEFLKIMHFSLDKTANSRYQFYKPFTAGLGAAVINSSFCTRILIGRDVG